MDDRSSLLRAEGHFAFRRKHLWRHRPLITTASLKTQSWKDLADLAKTKGLSGWHSMRKDELVKALLRAAQRQSKVRSSNAVHKTSGGHKTAKSKSIRRPTSVKRHASHSPIQPHANGSKTPVKLNGNHPTTAKTNGAAKTNGTAGPVEAKMPVRSAKQQRIADKIHRANAERERLKDLSGSFTLQKSGKRKAPEKDRLVLIVRDPYWLQAIWTVTRLSVKRAEAALAEHWHTAGPVLRLMEVDSGHTTSTAERVSREIEVHGGVTNWYIEVNNPPHSFRAELGYKAANGKFYSLCRSNVVHTPAPDSGDVIDENWTDVAANYERVYALSGGYSEDNNQSGELQELFEERLRRPMGNGSNSQFGSGAERVLNRHRNLEFHVDAEMILYGKTKPDAKVTLGGEPIKLRPDGSFTVRQPMPDKRQVLPVVASSPDGVEQRTIVIAVERNTKVLEPMVRETND
ncbi:MAG TPA: DUF4912 domain-containing protein [Pirellulaceae bacterium]|jgi:hypothetical protein